MENERTEKIKNMILWGISIFLILSMLVYIGETTAQAILMGILGILVMPSVNRKINEKIINGNKTKNTIKIISEIILFFVIVCNIPTNENTSSTNNINKQNINNTINQNNTISNAEEQVNTIQQQNTTQSLQTETSTNTESTTTTSTSAFTSTNSPSSTSDSTTKSSSASTSSSTSKTTASKSRTAPSSQTTNVDNSRTVYVTPTGKRYHYISTCGGKNSTASTLNQAIARGLTPCQKCAK